MGQTYEFAPEATDADEDVLTFAIENRPGWASFSPTTGRLSGRPPASAAARTYADIQISVSDSKAVAELPAYDLEVEGDPNANTPPAITGTPSTTATVGNAYSFTPDATDPDGQVLSFSIANLPSWASFDTLTGELSGTPADRRRRPVRRDRDLRVGRRRVAVAAQPSPSTSRPASHRRRSIARPSSAARRRWL